MSEPILRPSSTSDSSLESSLNAEYDERGWLDCNPEAKMELADLDKEEYISDDETEVMPSSNVRSVYMELIKFSGNPHKRHP